jgi:hypothetical protein
MQLGWRCESNRFKLDAGVMLITRLIPQMHRAFVIQSPGMRPTKSLALSRITDGAFRLRRALRAALEWWVRPSLALT